MTYLCLGFSVVWICHFVYLFIIDGKIREMRRIMDLRAGETTSGE
jgi:hypothetical protein